MSSPWMISPFSYGASLRSSSYGVSSSCAACLFSRLVIGRDLAAGGVPSANLCKGPMPSSSWNAALNLAASIRLDRRPGARTWGRRRFAQRPKREPLPLKLAAQPTASREATAYRRGTLAPGVAAIVAAHHIPMLLHEEHIRARAVQCDPMNAVAHCSRMQADRFRLAVGWRRM